MFLGVLLGFRVKKLGGTAGEGGGLINLLAMAISTNALQGESFVINILSASKHWIRATQLYLPPCEG